MRNKFLSFISLCFCLLFIACSGESEQATGTNNHVWKEQTETIDKAKEVEGMLMDSAEASKKMIEQQSQ